MFATLRGSLLERIEEVGLRVIGDRRTTRIQGAWTARRLLR